MTQYSANYGFRLIKTSKVKDLDITVKSFEHQTTGARLFYVDKADDNKTFGVTFKTIPQDSSGVAHILEHIVLCGSKNYPIKDPFFSMLKRSLKNFMNALTSNDWTMYPFATVNEKDFFNLLDVYLDAAFFPNLNKHSFLQEGWRFELNNKDDLTSDFEVKGVVFNEMKGAMSTQHSIMMQRLLTSLFPNNTYHYNSGGEPYNILDLEWEHLKKFHKNYYHPSNALFFLYGNLPLERCMNVINQKVLRFFNDKQLSIQVEDAIRYQSPKYFKFPYPKDESNPDNHQLAVAWLNKSLHSFEDVWLFKILSNILLQDSGALLRKSLIESKLGSSLADGCGYHTDIKETFFVAGLKGVKAADLKQAESLIHKTLLDIANSNIAQERIDSALHSFELSIRDLSIGSYPTGLVLLFNIIDPWIHGLDPVFLIDFPAHLESIKTKLKDKKLINRMIKENLINNPHRVTIDLYPDDKYFTNQDRDIATKVKAKQAKSSKEDVLQIVKSTADLSAKQAMLDDLSILPKVTTADITAQEATLDKNCINFFSFNHAQKKLQPIQSFNDSSLAYYALPTNKMCYLDLEFILPQLNTTEQLLLPVLGKLLVGAGTAKTEYDQLALIISRYSGGISISPDVWPVFSQNSLAPAAPAGGPIRCSFSLSSKCLVENFDKMLSISHEILADHSFHSLDRIDNILTQRADRLLLRLLDAGHKYTMGRAASLLNPICNIEETYAGISQIFYSIKISKLGKDKLADLSKQSHSLAKKIINSSKKRLVINAPPDSKDYILDKLQILTDLLHSDTVNVPSDFSNILDQTQYKKEVYLTATTVSYVSRAFKTFDIQNELSPALLVLSKLLGLDFLHKKIRELGGAYGAFSIYDNETGLFYLGSYRDPNLSKTWDVFNHAFDWACTGDFSADDLDSAIVQVFSGLDAPLSVNQRAYHDYSYLEKNISLEFRNNYRQRLLNMNKDQIVKAATAIKTCEFADVAITSADIWQRESAHFLASEFNIVNI